jgi:lipoprotein NlpI
MRLSPTINKHFRMIIVCSFLVAELCYSNSMAAPAISCTDFQNEPNPLLQVSKLTQCLDHEKLSKTERIEALKQRAGRFIQLGRQPQAINDFNSALKLSPDDAECYNGRGIAFKRMGDYEQAMANYTRAMELQALQPVTQTAVSSETTVKDLKTKPLLPVKIVASSQKKTANQNSRITIITQNE